MVQNRQENTNAIAIIKLKKQMTGHPKLGLGKGTLRTYNLQPSTVFDSAWIRF